MKSAQTWIVIADGAKARIMFNDGPGHGVRAVEDMSFTARNLPSREINADRPGRGFGSHGDGSRMMEPTVDAHRLDQKNFATSLAGILRDELQGGRYNRLIIVAAPAMLGDLRAALSKQVASVIIAEIDKDLTQVKDNELVRHLEKVLAV